MTAKALASEGEPLCDLFRMGVLVLNVEIFAVVYMIILRPSLHAPQYPVHGLGKLDCIRMA